MVLKFSMNFAFNQKMYTKTWLHFHLGNKLKHTVIVSIKGKNNNRTFSNRHGSSLTAKQTKYNTPENKQFHRYQ